MQRMQVVPYGFGRIALYKASWREGRREFSGWKQTDRDGQWTMKWPVRQEDRKTGRTTSFRERGSDSCCYIYKLQKELRMLCVQCLPAL